MTRPSLAGIEQRTERSPLCTWTAVPALTAAVRDVLALHESLPNSRSALFPHPLCACGKAWPCETVRTLAARLDLTDPEGDPR